MPKIIRSLMKREASSKQILSQADRARDERDWMRAVKLYSTYLEKVPEHQAIWVQLGHALKEEGLHTDAIKAYVKAVGLNPIDMDARLHLAFLAKRSGEPAIALDNFSVVAAAQPTKAILDELETLKSVSISDLSDAVSIRDEQTIFLEIGDVLTHIEHHNTITGISRVVSAISYYLLAHPSEDMRPVVWDRASECFHLVPLSLLKKITDFTNNDQVQIDNLRSLIADFRSRAKPINLNSGDIYVMPGAFWQIGRDQSFFVMLNQLRVRLVIYIYDLIPLTDTNFCELSFATTFGTALSEAAPFVDQYLTISSYVANQLRIVLSKTGLPIPPITAVPLAHVISFNGNSKSHELSKKIAFLSGKHFVLCVCTIEARKNHSFLLDAWQKLIDDDVDVPELVFVGRIGWRVQDLMHRLTESRFLNGKVHILQNISDLDLSKLYDLSLFTTFPSFVEGWGLPVGESLAHSKICVASSTSSIPEVGGDVVVYIDPFNLHSGIATFRRLIEDHQYRTHLEERIKRQFKPRTWGEVSSTFFDELRKDNSFSSPSKERKFAPHFPSGEIVRIRDVFDACRLGMRYLPNPTRLMFRSGWHSVEQIGTWMEKPIAKIEFKTDFPHASDLFVVLRVASSPWVGPRNSLSVEDDGPLSEHGFPTKERKSIVLKESTNFWIKTVAKVDEFGVLSLRFRVDGEIIVEEPHSPVSVRLYEFGYCLKSDTNSRLQLLESIILDC